MNLSLPIYLRVTLDSDSLELEGPELFQDNTFKSA